MACCDTPSPRVLESSGRLFCGNCRRYLDAAAQPKVETKTLRVGVIHLARCVGASLPTPGSDERLHAGDYACGCPCHELADQWLRPE